MDVTNVGPYFPPPPLPIPIPGAAKASCEGAETIYKNNIIDEFDVFYKDKNKKNMNTS